MTLHHDLHMARLRIARLEEALREMIYATTHLSPMRDDGSHWCRITKGTLAMARAALTQPASCPRPAPASAGASEARPAREA